MPIVSQLFHAYSSERPEFKRAVSPVLGRLFFQRPFKAAKKRVLIIYFPNNIGISQVDPFFYYYSSLTSELDVDLRAISLSDFLRSEQSAVKGADIVILQTLFELSDKEADAIFRRLKEHHPNSKIIYFDWFAHLDLRLASRLNDRIDQYVKRQVFRDIGTYTNKDRAKNNLEMYYSKLYGLDASPANHEIPEGFFQKLKLGPGFFTSRLLLERFVPKHPPRFERTIDIHARMASQKSDWYGFMRRHAVQAVQTIEGRQILTEPNVGVRKFYQELYRSKLCFSPFGYGEICWRDYEAMMSGSLLIKPDVSHLVTEPDIFVQFETYVPVAWNFEDLAEKANYYLDHDIERARIAENAYQAIHKYVSEQRFIEFSKQLFGI